MTISLSLPNVSLRDRAADWLRMLAAWLIQLANRLSPQKRYHRGEAPMFGGPALTLPTDLEMAFGSIKAAILQKLLEWINHNERQGQTFYQGHYWTHISYNKLHQNHFPKRHPDTLRKYIRAMEKAGFIISCRPDPTDDKWYRLNMKAISKAVLAAGDSPRGAGQKSTGAGKAPTPPGPTAHPKTTMNLQLGNSQIKSTNPNQQQQPLQDETDVVVDLPSSEPEPISGEHPLEGIQGEGHDATAVKAFVETEKRHDESPLPKIPLKGFSQLAANLIDFGIASDVAERLVAKHGEADIRHVLRYAQSPAAKNLINPPGFVVDTLDGGKAGSLPAVQPQTSLSSLSPWVQHLNAEDDYDAERIAELEAREHIPPLPEPVGLDEKPDGSMTVREIWLCAHDQMRLLFGHYEFETMLKDARLFSYEQGMFRIGVLTSHAQDMLQHRYYRSVQRIIEGLHNSPVNLVFEVCPSLNWNLRSLTASEIEELRRLRADRALV